VGRQTNLETIAIGPDDNMEDRRVDILEAVKRVDAGQGVIILTDMFGGTPSNLAISVMDETKAEVIAGINLPILVKLASIRTELPLEKAVSTARDAGRKYIKVASQELAGSS
jgi:PTS system mannose-specific IIA component